MITGDVLKIDHDLCVVCGNCVTWVPDVFSIRYTTLSTYLKIDEPEVQNILRSRGVNLNWIAIDTAIQDCPTEAISWQKGTL